MSYLTTIDRQSRRAMRWHVGNPASNLGSDPSEFDTGFLTCHLMATAGLAIGLWLGKASRPGVPASHIEAVRYATGTRYGRRVKALILIAVASFGYIYYLIRTLGGVGNILGRYLLESDAINENGVSTFDTVILFVVAACILQSTYELFFVRPKVSLLFRSIAIFIVGILLTVVLLRGSRNPSLFLGLPVVALLTIGKKARITRLMAVGVPILSFIMPSRQ